MQSPGRLAKVNARQYTRLGHVWWIPALPRLWISTFLVLILWTAYGSCMTDGQIADLRQETRDLFYHGYDNYLKHAFPEDELRPLSCGPLTRDRENPSHIELNDALGNYSLTLVDSLSTLAILASAPLEEHDKPSSGKRKHADKALQDFQNGIALLVENYGDGSDGPGGVGKRARGFDLDSKVQVFETVIRGVGGLLSAHLFAMGDLPIRGYKPLPTTRNGQYGLFWSNGLVYDGQLLRLATDLANRLLPAFETPTGLPYPRVNLRTGIPFYLNSPLNMDAEHGQCPPKPPKQVEITETCSAGAGSLVLEFTTLSRLTNDPRYERAAKRAFWAVWEHRASTGLIGSGIDAESGQWIGSVTGVGAGIDSYFEYAFKSYIMLSGLPYDESQPELHSPDAFLEAWHEAHDAIQRHVYRGPMFQHPHYVQVDLYTGALRAFWVDSLSAYYPGLLTLAGELEEAISAHLLYTAIWTRYSALPERWSTMNGNVEAGLRWWGGRPEFTESTWYIYRATGDPWYLHVGEMVLRDIKRRCWTKCGWAGLQDVRTGEKMDRMESFFLGETAKYLYLLFDPDHPLNRIDANFVFTTEGHPLIVPRKYWHNTGLSSTAAPTKPVQDDWQLSESAFEAPTCPLPPMMLPLTVSPTAARQDVWHAASLARLHLMPSLETVDSPFVEYSADHPSVTISDIRSPSNYTYYPWTLPPQLVPADATCAKLVIRATFDLSFPNLPESNALHTLQRVFEGIWVNSMSGLRLGMIRESSSVPFVGGHATEPSLLTDGLDTFRIYAVSNVGLGRDEKVFLKRNLVSEFNPVDPYFTRVRDKQVLDIVADVGTSTVRMDVTSSAEAGYPSTASPANQTSSPTRALDALDDLDSPSLFSSLFHNIQSILSDGLSPSQGVESAPHMPALTRHDMEASIPTGPGAAPLKDMDEPPPFDEDGYHASRLPWKTVHVHDGTLCTNTISADIVKEHQILVIRRGGCSFWDKLKNIPTFAPHSRSLQLLIVVSDLESAADAGGDAAQGQNQRHGRTRQRSDQQDAESKGLIQPYVDQLQLTPSGLPRPNPIAMVMMGGGDQTMDLLRRARGLGMRRRWWFESQGVRIENLIVL